MEKFPIQYQFYENKTGAQSFYHNKILKNKPQYLVPSHTKKLVSSLPIISDGVEKNIPLGYEPNATNGSIVKQIWARPIRDQADEELEKGSLVFCKNTPMHQTFPIKDAVALADIPILNYLFDAYRTEYDTIEKCLEWNFLGVIRNEMQQYKSLLKSYKIRLFNVVVNGTIETINYWKKAEEYNNIIEEEQKQSQIELGEHLYLVLKKVQKCGALLDPNGNIRSIKHMRNVFQWIPASEQQISGSFVESLHFYNEELSITMKSNDPDEEEEITHTISIKKPSHIIRIGTILSKNRFFLVNGQEKNKLDIMID